MTQKYFLRTSSDCVRDSAARSAAHSFQLTRLLNNLAFVIRTCSTVKVSGRFQIVAVTVKKLKVVGGVCPASPDWDQVIHLHHIFFLKPQSTFRAFSALFLEQSGYSRRNQRVAP